MPHGPEAQKANAELPLQTSSSVFRLQAPLDRVTDVRRDVPEIGQSVGTARDAFSIIPDDKILRAALAASLDDNRSGACVDAVLDKFHDQPLTIARTLLVGNPWPGIAYKGAQPLRRSRRSVKPSTLQTAPHSDGLRLNSATLR